MKKFILFLCVAAFIASGVYFYFTTYISHQQEQIKQLEDCIELLKEEAVPVKFVIRKRENQNIRVAVKFIDMEGKEITKIEHVLVGEELSFDFVVIEVKNRYVAFPYKLFSDQVAADNGLSLIPYYDNEGFPEVFNSSEMNHDLRQALSGVFAVIKSNKTNSLTNQFGNMVHDFAKFRQFTPETVYKIVTHTKGGIEVVGE